MGAPDFLADLSALGYRLNLEGEGIRVEPKPADDVRAFIVELKGELLAQLRADEQHEPPDDRIRCTACACLAGGGRCLAAARGELKGVARTYSPALVLRRCEAFAPLSGDPDRRTGRERWPDLSEC